MLNWSALNPGQVKGTVFNDLNDEKLAEVLDLSYLEEMFKIGNTFNGGGDMMSSTSTANSADQPQVSPGGSLNSNGAVAGGGAQNTNKATLLGQKRLQNIGNGIFEIIFINLLIISCGYAR